MLFSILTLFPEIFPPVFDSSILGRAQKNKQIVIRYINIRDFARNRHHTVDDKPYGGGVGMIMKVDIIDKALIFAKESAKKIVGKKLLAENTLLLDPKGKLFNQSFAGRLSLKDHLILVCGHYEGIDARVEKLVDNIVSIGQFILTGGEIPAMAVTDTVTRLIKGVLKPGVTGNESFTHRNKLEYPQYTRPPVYRDMKVPEILLSGNHEKIRNWKEKHQKETKPI